MTETTLFMHLLLLRFGLVLLLLGGWEKGVASELNPLKRIRSFMVLLDNLDDEAEVQKVAASGYDLVVVDPTFTSKDAPGFDARTAVARLKAGKPGRLVLAYADIGEAERERTYWQDDWTVPEAKKGRGVPSFLLAPDAEDPEGDVVVAFWEPQWQAMWLGSGGKGGKPGSATPAFGGLGAPNRSAIGAAAGTARSGVPAPGGVGLVAQFMTAGFDGLVLDGIDSYDDDEVELAAKHAKVTPERAMVDFIAALRKEMLRVQPRGVLVTLDGMDLIEDEPRAAGLFEGAIFEETWFSAEDEDAEWDDAGGGDVANVSTDPEESTVGLLKVMKKWQQAGVTVMTMDFCLKPENAAKVYSESRREGFVPLVTRVSMEHLTTTPPPGMGR